MLMTNIILRSLAVVATIGASTMVASASASSSSCATADVIPGWSLVGVGFDALRGAQMALPILELTCDLGQTWTNPYVSSADNATFVVPDQLNVVNAYGLEVDSQVFETATQYAQSLGVAAGLDTSYAEVFSLSPAVSSVREQVSGSDAVYSVVRQLSKIYRLSALTPPVANLSSTFLSDISNLPETYADESYANFVTSYGTHVVVSAVMGGVASMESYVDSNFVNTSSTLQISLASKVQFWSLRDGIGGDYNHLATSSSYQDGCENLFTVNLEGGNPVYANDPTMYAEWVASIAANPSTVSYQLVPIQDLFPDSETTRAGNLANYVSSYFTSAANLTDPEPEPKTELALYCSNFTVDNNDRETYGEDGLLLYGTNTHDGTYPKLPLYQCSPCYSFASVLPVLPPGLEDKKRGDMTGRRVSNRRPRHRRRAPGSLMHLPGVDAIGVGFDAVRGEQRGLRVIEYSYSSNSTFANENLPYTYIVPDQIAAQPSSAGGVTTTVYTSLSDYASALGNGGGLDISLPGIFSLSSQVESVKSVFSMEESVMSVVQDQQQLYEIELYPSKSNATKTFAGAVESLRGFSANDTVFANFVRNWGTHVVVSGEYGGVATMRSIVNQQFFSSSSDLDVQASTSFAYDLFRLGVSVNTSSSDTVQNFDQSTLSEVILEGGDYADYTVAEFDDWLASVAYAPTQVTFRLESITSFVEDDDIASELDVHITSYLKANALETNTVSRMHVDLPSLFNDQGDKSYTCDADDDSYVGIYHYYKDNKSDMLEVPLLCTTPTASMDDETMKISRAECVTSDTGMCEFGYFIVGYAGEHHGWTGHYPTLPATCCRMRATFPPPANA